MWIHIALYIFSLLYVISTVNVRCMCTAVSSTVKLLGVDSFLETNSSSDSESRNSLHVMKLKVHCNVHKILSLVLILSQISPLHAPSSCFSNMNIDTILPSIPVTFNLSPFFKFYHQNILFIPLPCHEYHNPSDFILFDRLG